MAVPVLKVNGKEITLPRPTMKMWRLVAEYDDKPKENWQITQLVLEHSAMLAAMYGLDNADDIDPADVLPGYVEAATYIINVANERLKNLPKEVTEEAK